MLRAMEMSPQRAKRWLTEAEGYRELEMYDQALERLLALRDCPHYPLEYALLLGSVYRDRQEYQSAVPWFEKALQLDPGNVLATVGLGWCLKRSQRLGEAIQLYQAAIPQHPREALLHYNLACYLSLLGRTSDALGSLERALDLDADFRELMAEEKDFDPIRNLPEFQKLADKPEKPEASGGTEEEEENEP
jgi:tetratricopeptide (TPR) repeat protein